MGNYNDYYQAIYEIKDCLKKDLFGVSDEYEILEDVEPLSAYVTGILYPRKASQISDNSSNLDFFDEKDININDDIEIESNDDTITEANKYKPSSMGISAMIPSAVKKLPVIFECGTYKHSEEIKIIEKQVSVKSQSSDDEVITETKERLVNYYSRIPRKFSVEFNIPDKNCTISEICLGEIQARINLTIRKIMPDGSKLITVTVVNEAIEKNKLHFRNETALFQCKVSVNSEYSFLPVYQNLYPESDIESQIKCLLYRTVKNYGYGHGCSVTYEESEKGVFEISSDFIPSEEVLQMVPGKIENEEILYLNNWKCSERNKLCKKLEVFIDEYYKWKECKKEESDNLDLFCSATSEILRRIELCINRLKNGVRTLLTDDYAWKAFVFMNEAMLLQRVKTKYQKAETVKWYPFQLAYILQIIPDITNAESEYHNTVDLLWFPTGGGKTEAYLGVAAFTIFYRRLSGCAVNNGVAVIMRYTLRLLTIQQFERAAAMVCACEYIRRVNNLSGGEISIGLWIGSGMTPNHIDKAKEVLQKLKQNKDEKIYEGNPVQITKCPWCGKDIDVTGYDITADGMTICCKDNPECEFHKKLPIYVVDDDIYRNKPTFLLSTIDKFARITWVEESKNLFGVDDTPPSLIIQDELHLISNSLGSLDGLYEIAVDFLCQHNDTLPKIIASTATVKNADEQIKNLYNRKMLQFPPNGIDFRDSFFAQIASRDERPARTYIGMCENGGSISDLLVRTYGTLSYIKALFKMQNKKDEIIDQYYTIIGYFNAIRDLGASANILQDRMDTHINTLIKRKFKVLSEELGLTKSDIPYFNNEELTSRKTAKEIKDTLQRLEENYKQSGCYSYVLASNMLSVGIDINRLGLMTVYNQPKTNSEYIQATSRVGRQNPGVVIALYNTMRSRDKSHYEQFGFYHKSFYQYVEATSVTPFSEAAMAKALHCVFVAMVRLTIPKLGANHTAKYFSKNDPAVLNIKSFIINRISELNPKSAKYAESILDEFMDIWEYYITINSELCYIGKNDGECCLLNSAENTSNIDFPPILNSLRNVEASANIYIKK